MMNWKTKAYAKEFRFLISALTQENPFLKTEDLLSMLGAIQEKMGDFINDIEIPLKNEIIPTGLSKFGAIVGDKSEVGCNAVVFPGALIGKDNWIYPNCTIPKGFHPPGHFLTPTDHKPRSRRK